MTLPVIWTLALALPSNVHFLPLDRNSTQGGIPMSLAMAGIGWDVSQRLHPSIQPIDTSIRSARSATSSATYAMLTQALDACSLPSSSICSVLFCSVGYEKFLALHFVVVWLRIEMALRCPLNAMCGCGSIEVSGPCSRGAPPPPSPCSSTTTPVRLSSLECCPILAIQNSITLGKSPSQRMFLLQ